jgi:hypothetical protein
MGTVFCEILRPEQSYLNFSPFTKQVHAIRFIVFYEISTENTVSPHLVQDIHFAVYERSTGNRAERERPENEEQNKVDD